MYPYVLISISSCFFYEKASISLCLQLMIITNIKLLLLYRSNVLLSVLFNYFEIQLWDDKYKCRQIRQLHVSLKSLKFMS